MGPADPDCSPAQLAARDEILSHINVARMILSTRLDRGLTQQELGRAAGTKQSRISEIEALKGNPRLDTLDRIARVLGLMITLVPRETVPAAEKVPVEHVAEFGYVLEWGAVEHFGIATGNRHAVFLSLPNLPMKA